MAEEFWRNGPYDFEMILLDAEGTAHITRGIADSFDSNYPVNVV